MQDVYSENAQKFFDQYEQLDFAHVHGSWLGFSRTDGGRALDVGAGSGRDAKGLSAIGYQVLAVEPAARLRQLGETATASASVEWLGDTLPDLAKVVDRKQRFDLILISAVWMHLNEGEQKTALPALSQLLVPSGLLIITLRHGPSTDARVFHEISSRDLNAHAKTLGLETILNSADDDKLQRAAVSWETIVFRKPASSE